MPNASLNVTGELRTQLQARKAGILSACLLSHPSARKLSCNSLLLSPDRTEARGASGVGKSGRRGCVRGARPAMPSWLTSGLLQRCAGVCCTHARSAAVQQSTAALVSSACVELAVVPRPAGAPPASNQRFGVLLEGKSETEGPAISFQQQGHDMLVCESCQAKMAERQGSVDQGGDGGSDAVSIQPRGHQHTVGGGAAGSQSPPQTRELQQTLAQQADQQPQVV